MFKHIKSDAISGFLVFLIALPLCLGIAKASGFPPIAGIYTAVIGGLIVTFLSNSQLTIKGPAAGLIIIALGAVEELGGPDHAKGYQLTLAIVVVSGVIQVIFGLIKSGKLGDFFPLSVIHGMLAAIGIIIMSKQIHIAMGVVPAGKEPVALIEELPHSFMNMNPEVAIIGLVSLLILFLHPLIKNKSVKRIPAPLIVLIIAVPLGYVFDLSHEHDYVLGSLQYHINPEQLLVALPDNFFEGITYPDFSQITSPVSIKYIIMFAMVGSIESLLSAKAIDSIDPQHRKSNLNKDLIAVGIGNTIAGFIGGLPMISEIVRSSANINNGGKTKASNWFHGLFLFLFAFLAAALIQKIPNAALSAMLVYTGFKLAAPKEFKKVKKLGYDQLLLFVVTIVVTLLTDILIGVGVGIVLKIILHLMSGISVKELFVFQSTTKETKEGLFFKLKGATSFINYLKFKSIIEKQPRDSQITLDFQDVKLADHTFLENVHQLQNDFTQNGGRLVMIGFEHHHFHSLHTLAARKRVQNPLITHEDNQLSKRQQDFYGLAKQQGYDYERTVIGSMVRPYLSPFAILKRFKSARNIVIGTHDKFDILICEIEYQKVSDFIKEKSIGTIAIIQNLDTDIIPEFYLEKDVLIGSFQKHYDFHQVDLSHHETTFDLYGNNVAELNMFFDENVVKTMNKSNYTVESKRRSILVHKDFERISGEDNLQKLMRFTLDVAERIVTKK